jgi:L-arabinose isomerase
VIGLNRIQYNMHNMREYFMIYDEMNDEWCMMKGEWKNWKMNERIERWMKDEWKMNERWMKDEWKMNERWMMNDEW